MPNMSPKKAPMPTQDPEARITNFEEVAMGYTPQMAVEEASAVFTANINHVSRDVRSMSTFPILSKR